MHEACNDDLCTNLLASIKNKNEERVARQMSEVLKAFPDYKPDALDIQDIFALALNSLPARYKQKGTIVLSESVTKEEIEAALRFAVGKVRGNPKHGTRE